MLCWVRPAWEGGNKRNLVSRPRGVATRLLCGMADEDKWRGISAVSLQQMLKTKLREVYQWSLFGGSTTASFLYQNRCLLPGVFFVVATGLPIDLVHPSRDSNTVATTSRKPPRTCG